MLYPWCKALHIVAVTAWMAGLFYLPRLFVYHAGARPGSELSETLKIMERRLLRIIMNPAMVGTYIFGMAMDWLRPDILDHAFMWVKLACVGLLTIFHMMLARYRRLFAEDRNPHSGKFFRILNEIPTFLLIVIVIMIVVRPGP